MSKAILADKAYGSKAILKKIAEKQSITVIPPKKKTINPWEYDKHSYKERHAIECFFSKDKRT